MTTPSIKITNFDIEATTGEPARLAFTLGGIPFEDHRIHFFDWPKFKKKTPFGQLPVLEIDGGPMIAQSGAMLRYAGSLSENQFLYPTSTNNNDKLLQVEEALGITDDLNRAFEPSLTMGSEPSIFGYEEHSHKTDEGKARTAALRTAFVKEELPKYLGFYEKLLDRSGGDWLIAGDKPTIADCYAVPSLRLFSRGYLDAVPANCLNTHPKVVAYLERFCALPEIAGRYEDSGIGGTKRE